MYSLAPHFPRGPVGPEVTELTTVDCHPISLAPGMSQLYLDYCAAAAQGSEALRNFYPALGSQAGWPVSCWREPVHPLPAHWPELLRLLAAQNRGPGAAGALAALREGARMVVTGQQVGLFGGPLYTPLKAATALAHARQATAAGRPHAAVFWLASEDHDFAEINHVVFPARHALRKLTYPVTPAVPSPAGSVALTDAIAPLLDEAWELLGASDAMDALVAAYKPGRTFAEAFASFYSTVFAAQGLLVLDPSSRDFHRLGAPVLRAAIERADELHAALVERNGQLQAAGYHAQVAVAPQSSLLFLLEERTGARIALKRMAPTAAEPGGVWHAGHRTFSTAELLGILEAEPERISPAALLRPVFQDFLLSTSLTIGGPGEIAYFAQSSVLYERILGRTTPALPRFSATLIEPATGETLRKHSLLLEQVFGQTADALAQQLANRAMPAEGRAKLASAGQALEADLGVLLAWMQSQDAALGRSALTAASKMRYQMNRLRRLAANYQLQRETSLRRSAEILCRTLYPAGTLQERVHGAAYYFARHGLDLAEELTARAAGCTGHAALWL